MTRTQARRSARSDSTADRSRARLVAPLIALGLLAAGAAGAATAGTAVADSSWTRVGPSAVTITLADSSWTALPTRPAGTPAAPLDSLWD